MTVTLRAPTPDTRGLTIGKKRYEVNHDLLIFVDEDHVADARRHGFTTPEEVMQGRDRRRADLEAELKAIAEAEAAEAMLKAPPKAPAQVSKPGK